MNYSDWKTHVLDTMKVSPSDMWWDSNFHYWWRKDTFDFLCGAYGAVYETVIGSIFFRLYSYNSKVAGSHQHLCIIKKGKWKKIYTCDSTDEAQNFAHRYIKDKNND